LALVVFAAGLRGRAAIGSTGFVVQAHAHARRALAFLATRLGVGAAGHAQAHPAHARAHALTQEVCQADPLATLLARSAAGRALTRAARPEVPAAARICRDAFAADAATAEAAHVALAAVLLRPAALRPRLVSIVVVAAAKGREHQQDEEPHRAGDGRTMVQKAGHGLLQDGVSRGTARHVGSVTGPRLEQAAKY
jgi:hypothetical protein